MDFLAVTKRTHALNENKSGNCSKCPDNNTGRERDIHAIVNFSVYGCRIGILLNGRKVIAEQLWNITQLIQGSTK